MPNYLNDYETSRFGSGISRGIRQRLLGPKEIAALTKSIAYQQK